MALKRDISAAEWEGLVQDVRASVETETPNGPVELYKCVPGIASQPKSH